ncbi:Ig-like domain-containing protein [Microbacterium sp.]|uniref:Ig-like domain-containing protein n=1 Tax=Microbacterium sp. TaxID=51671 RepID=UPI0025EDB9A3|nr:Ig-like domain-containing protein [Microbacterium sp.]
MTRRRTAVGLSAAALAIALVAGVSVAWPGLDAQETPVQRSSAWVLQADGLRYARVNSVVGELDTVRAVNNPSRIVDADTGAYMFTDSDSKVIRIDDAAPVDLDADRLREASSAPPGTEEVDNAGDFVAYRTDAGAVYAGRLSLGSLTRVEPRESPTDMADNVPAYTSDAIAIDANGLLMSYSAADETVARVDVTTAEVLGIDPAPVTFTTPIVTAAGQEWVLVDSASGSYLKRGADASASAGTTGSLAVARADADADAVYIADETGLVRIPADGDSHERVFGDRTTARGTAARPVVRKGIVYAAWLPEGAGAGTLWSSADGDVPLDYAGLSLGALRRPVFTDAGHTLLLNDARSGWVWTAPSGALLPSTQNWDLDDRVETATQVGDDEPPPVVDPRPPVAVGDAFGVRPGALVSLPVLLNDHDPNEDVLAIDPASVTGLDPAFGTLTTTDDHQRLAVRVSADAQGTANFSYAVTDGTTADGLVSLPATATLTVAGDSENAAPGWCAVEQCQQTWPRPDVARGGTLRLPVLGDWVDPEGDPVLLLSATDPSGSGQVAVTSDGSVVYQHSDTGAEGEQIVSVVLTAGDARGATTTKTLVIRVADDPKPALQSFAVLDTAGSRVSVDVAPHVTGTAGGISVTSARVLDDAAAAATVVGGSTSFDFAAAKEGSYRVAVTVTAAGQEATGTVRITLLPPEAPADLSTAPVVAFVRPQADATVDVFAAVSNPTGRVLLLSDVVRHPATGASMEADAVGQSQLRVSGTTPTGEAGVLGTVTYRVSDGTEDAGSAVIGEATVYLLPATTEQAPIAVDDSVVVRVGSQVDIPVLSNDVAASGTHPRLDPESIVSSSSEVLAFASGDVLRYLAPATPGQYSVQYRAFTTGAPALGDVATVQVRVEADDANRDPLPSSLSGRVLSGLSTSIAVDGFGMDPDGDVVRLASIVAQPARGSAAISADGTSIVYTSVAGDTGQVEFTYRVVDALGAAGEGRVRIGILGGDADPSPVTYTDYVHVQVGADSVIRVHPLANDLDPMQGTLTLTSVRPDVPEVAEDGTSSPEYRRLSERIASVADDTVALVAGSAPATMTFLYDVESSSGNTARGLIVVRVVTQRVPDFPIVEDTILGPQDRDDLRAGVEVLDGAVLWSGGDASTLTVGLWGDPEGVQVSGSRIRGELGDEARLIAFSVTGQTSAGQVTTYAFLRVPAASEATVSLRPGVAPVQVAEGKDVTFDVSDFVSQPRGSVLEVGNQVRASGARAQGVCAAVSGTTLRYTAGSGAPWTDGCLVSARVAGQSTWAVLSIPVVVTPIDPQPIVSPASFEIAPGDGHVVDLSTLTTWQGDPEPIAYRIGGHAASFDVTLSGETLALRAHDDAFPSAVESVSVEVTSHAGVTPARITLRVGAAPSTLPQGGTVQQQCSQASGSSCTIEVIGAPGEVNALPSTPLTLVAASPASACAGVSFAVASATRVVASWTEDAPGATCAATFTVRDAQGRVSSAARDGRITLDLRGFPQAPASVRQSAYADGSLTLRVDPGAAAAAAPAITGFTVRQAGQVVATCAPQGLCPEIAAPNGERRTYEVVAVNAVGASRAAVRTVAWAYEPPAAPTGVSSTPVVTAGEGGVAAITITGVDAAGTGALQISSPVGDTVSVEVSPRQTSVTVRSFRVGSNTPTTVTVTPISRFDAPPGVGGPASESVTVSAHGIGAPLSPTLTLSAVNTGNGRAEVTAVGTATSGGEGSTLRYGIVPEGRTCTTSAGGDRAVFSNLPDGRQYTFVLCAESWLDGVRYGRVTASADVRAAQNGGSPRGYTFVVGPAAHVADGRATWTIDQAPTSPETPPVNNAAVFDRFPSSVFDTDPGIRVRYEHTSGWWQSAWGSVAPAPGSAPYQVQARWSLGSCTGGALLAPSGSSTDGRASITFGGDQITYFDAAGAVLPTGEDPLLVPAAAVRVSGVGVRVDWAAWNLEPAIAEMSATCTPLPAITP